MVWIHGGSFITGESDDYDPAALVRHGVIVVTINYRLGALGFLAHPALASHPGGSSGDYGLMDQQAALRWVQANIARFGGNPRDLTQATAAATGRGHEAVLDEPRQDRIPQLAHREVVAPLRRHQPADAVPDPAPAAGRNRLRRRTPLRVLGPRQLVLESILDRDDPDKSARQLRRG